MTKKFILLFLILLFIFTFIAEADDQLKIAVIPKSLDNPIFLDTFEAVNQKALKLGVKVEWVSTFNKNNQELIAMIRRLITRDIDGIIASVDDTPAFREVIAEAVAAGIPVATFDADSPSSKRLFYTGIDNYKAGKAAAKGLVRIVKERNLTEKPLQAMILTGGKDALNLNLRINGFLDYTDQNINLTVSDTLYCNDDFQKAIELLENYINKNPAIDLIFFVGGWPFYVPPDALPEFQKWAKQGGVSVGIDIFYSALVLQKEGLLQYLIGQDFRAMGEKSLEYLVKYLRTGDRPPGYVEVGLEYATEENIDELIEIYKPWQVK